MKRSRTKRISTGLDYVSHEDILPYNSTDQIPIQHELFERFLMYDHSKARDTLRAWQEKNHPWLELSDVHRETTESIRVTVIPFYMGMRWRYCIRLENLGNEVVQLRERHWRIFSLSGTLETVRGRGVVGRQALFTTSRLWLLELWQLAPLIEHMEVHQVFHDLLSTAFPGVCQVELSRSPCTPLWWPQALEGMNFRASNSWHCSTPGGLPSVILGEVLPCVSSFPWSFCYGGVPARYRHLYQELKQLQHANKLTQVSNDMSHENVPDASVHCMRYQVEMESITSGTLHRETEPHYNRSVWKPPAMTVENEIAIMKKLGHHHNILQLLDWNTSREPYVFLMEFVNQGTLKSFLQRYKEPLSSSKDSQHLLMVAAYHIALAMEYVRSKMVVHGDLALRNILVGRFPQECKITEFGLAKNFSRMKSRRSSHKRQNMDQVPLRWYPPEYFKHNYYSFKGDIWAFGIFLWELHTYGCLPYDHLHTSEDVVFHVCSGYRLKNPENCKAEVFQIMQECWITSPTLRPTFSSIVKTLEDILEMEADYVKVDNMPMEDDMEDLDS
ncbi:PDIP2 protein, partial [Polypterus senegalus]